MQEDLDHPKLSAIISHLNYEFFCYKYTVYRCAMKIGRLQKLLQTSTIPYKLVLAMFDSIKDAAWNYMIPPFQLISLIRNIYLSCEKLGYFKTLRSFNLENAVSLLTNFFWSIFDPHRFHSISLMEIKVSFLLLCHLPASSCLANEYYKLCMKDNNVSKLTFENLITIISKILTFIGEGTSYGSHNIPLIMNQLSQYSNGFNEYQFKNLWLQKNTRFLVYVHLLSLIKRIKDTEELVHNNVCTSCESKIIGICFKCKKCKGLCLCLKCFAIGNTPIKHESGHRMFEIFSDELPSRKLSQFFSKLCNILQQSSEQDKLFCIKSRIVNNIENDLKFEVESKQVESHQRLLLNSSEKLQSIIDRLLQQNSKIEKQLECIQTTSSEEISLFLTAHQEFLISIITEMKFYSCLLSNRPISSTPYRRNNSIVSESFSSENLSRSVNGADINRSYLDANKEYSFSELSQWFNQKREPHQYGFNENCIIETQDTEITNFKLLLNKIKEIVEDSFSNNDELTEATQSLENALIRIEEKRKKCLK